MVMKKRKKSMFNKKNSQLSDEDLEIVLTIENLQKELSKLHNNLNYVVDPVLIDSYIYQIQAVNRKYSYYIKLCKKHSVIADGFNFS